MANQQITYTLNFKGNFRDVQGQLNKLRQSLNSIVAMKMTPAGSISADVNAAADAALKFKNYLQTALDPKTGKLDLSRMQTQMKLSGDSANQLSMNLLKTGKVGAEAFMQITNAIINAQAPAHRFSNIMVSLGKTLMNTLRWQISSNLLTGVTSAFRGAIQFAENLNKTLNDIRIVTGASKEQMDAFAISANRISKEIGTTTNEFAKAALIYRQQGDSATEATQKAKITAKAANVAGTDAKEMSEYLTGIWNSYKVGAESLEAFADKLVRVGATTATSSEELATAMTKVAATAEAVGVSYDQLLATIATVSSATRLSAEQIGTAFKTIYARMGDLELKGIIDEGTLTTTLGSVSSQLKQVGVNVLDVNGNMRDTGLIVEDLGNRWEFLTSAQKTAVAEAVGGKRQYTQLFALFENWDEYKKTLKDAANAQGELNAQNDIYLDSIKGAKARLKAEKEELLIKLVDDETIQDFIDFGAQVLKVLNEIIDAAGGLKPIFMMLSGYLISKFAPQIANGITGLAINAVATIPVLGRKAAQSYLTEWEKIMAKAKADPAFANKISQAELSSYETLVGLKKELEASEGKITERQKQSLAILMDRLKLMHQEEETRHKQLLLEEQMVKTRAQSDISLRGGVTAKQVMSTGQMSTRDLQSQFGNTAEEQVAQKQLFQGIDKQAVVTVEQIAKNFALMDEDMQSIVTRNIANFFKDGKIASDELVKSVQRWLSADVNITSYEEGLLDIYRQKNESAAHIKTEMTGRIHMYDIEQQKLVDINKEVTKWRTAEGPQLMATQQQLNTSLQEKTSQRMAAEADNIQKQQMAQNLITTAPGAKSTTFAKKSGEALGRDMSRSETSTINTFVGHLGSGNAVPTSTMSAMTPIVEELSQTTEYTEGANNAVSRLVDAFKALDSQTNLDHLDAEIEEVKIKAEQVKQIIAEKTHGQPELFNGPQKQPVEKSPEEKRKEEVDAKIKDIKDKISSGKKESKQLRKSADKDLDKVTNKSRQSSKEKIKKAGREGDEKTLDSMAGKASKNKSKGKTTETKKDWETMEKAANKYKKAMSIDKEVKKNKKELKSLTKEQAQLSKEIKKTPKVDVGGEKAGKDIKGAVQGVSQLAGGLMSASMGATMLSNGFAAFKESEGTMQRIVAVTTMLSGVMSIANGIQTLWNATQVISTALGVKKTAVEVAETAAIQSKTAALKAAMAANPVGLIMGVVAALTILYSILGKNKKKDDSAKKDREANRVATERLAEAQEKLNQSMSNYKVYDDLHKKLVEAKDDKVKLLEITEELNKELGLNLNAADGGSAVYTIAVNELLRKKTEEAEQIEKDRQETVSATSDQMKTIVGKSAGTSKGAKILKNGKVTTAGDGSSGNDLNATQTRVVYQKYLELSESEKTAIKNGAAIDINVGGNLGEERFQWEQISAIVGQFEESINSIKDTVAANLAVPLDEDALFNELTQSVNGGKVMATLAEELSEKSTELSIAYQVGNTKRVEEIMGQLAEDFPTLKGAIEEQTKEMVIAMEENTRAIERAKAAPVSNALVYSSTSAFRGTGQAGQALLDDYASNQGVLSSEGITEYLSKLSEYGVNSGVIAWVEEKLRNPNVTSDEIAQVLNTVSTDSLMDNEEIKKALKQGNTDLIKKILEEQGVVNSEEAIQQMTKLANASQEVADRFDALLEDPDIDTEEEILSFFSDLQSELQMTTEQMKAFIIQEGIFNNERFKANVQERIAALREYGMALYEGNNELLYHAYASLDSAEVINNEKQLTEFEKQSLISNGYTIDENGKIKDGDRIVENFNEEYLYQASYWEAQSNLQLEYSNKTKQEMAELQEEHKEAMAEWEKENLIAKITDDLEILTDNLDKFEKKIANYDFAIELYGENGVPLTYYIKQYEATSAAVAEIDRQIAEILNGESEFEEGTQAYVDALTDRQDKKREYLVSMSEFEIKMREIRRDDEEFSEQGEDLFVEEANRLSQAMTDAIQSQYDLIKVTLDGLKEVLKLTEKSSNLSKKSMIAGAISGVTGKSAEEKQAERDRKREEKDLKRRIEDYEYESQERLRIKNKEYESILEEDQRITDEISARATTALNQGIAEREAERQKEFADLQKEHQETMTILAEQAKAAAEKAEQYIDGPWKKWMDLITANYNKDAFNANPYESNDIKFTAEGNKTKDVLFTDVDSSTKDIIDSIDEKTKTVTVRHEDKNGNTVGYTSYSGVNNIESLSADQEISTGTKLGSSQSFTLTKMDKEKRSGHTSFTETEKEMYGIGVAHKEPEPEDEEEEIGKQIADVTFNPQELYKDAEMTGVTFTIKYKDNSTETYSGISIGEKWCDGHSKKVENDDVVEITKNGGYIKQNWPNNVQELTDTHGNLLPSEILGFYGSGDKVTELADKLSSYEKYKGFAKGSESTPAGEAFVGEEGRELILLPDGRIVLAGQDGIELANLPAGAKVLTNKETEKVLSNKKDYANILMHSTTQTGKKVSYDAYSEGTSASGGLTSEDFTTKTQDIIAGFHEEELQKQIEHNTDIKTSLDERNTQIEEANKKHNENIERATAEHETKILDGSQIISKALQTEASKTKTVVENFINNMSFVLPAIDSEDFIKSIKDTLEKARDATGLPRSTDSDSTSTSLSTSGNGSGGGEEPELEGSGVTSGVREAYSYLRSLGATDTGAKTIIANLQGESGLDLDPHALGDGGKSHGIAQWYENAGRWQPVVQALGDEVWTRKGQLKYLIEDFQKNYPNIWKMASTEGVPAIDLMTALVKDYERPADIPGQISSRMQKLENLGGIKTLYADDMSLYDIMLWLQNGGYGLPLHLTPEQLKMYGAAGDWWWPVPQGQIGSGYGMRTHPIDGTSKMHYGLDLSRAAGTPIIAPRAGIVTLAAYSDSAGNWVKIDHGNGYETTYMHMLNFPPVSVGQEVKQGDIIGEVGSTGKSTGAHLHYEMRINGETTDPRPFLTAYSVGGGTKAGKALVGEYGPEIILYKDGTAGLLGENGMEYANLPAGAEIVPADETARILNSVVDYGSNRNPVRGYALGVPTYYYTSDGKRFMDKSKRDEYEEIYKFDHASAEAFHQTYGEFKGTAPNPSKKPDVYTSDGSHYFKTEREAIEYADRVLNNNDPEWFLYQHEISPGATQTRVNINSSSISNNSSSISNKSSSISNKSSSTSSTSTPVQIDPTLQKWQKETSALTQEEIKILQKNLSLLEYNIGTFANGEPLIDGVVGSKTAKALEDYCSKNGNIEDLLHQFDFKEITTNWSGEQITVLQQLLYGTMGEGIKELISTEDFGKFTKGTEKALTKFLQDQGITDATAFISEASKLSTDFFNGVRDWEEIQRALPSTYVNMVSESNMKFVQEFLNAQAYRLYKDVGYDYQSFEASGKYDESTENLLKTLGYDHMTSDYIKYIVNSKDYLDGLLTLTDIEDLVNTKGIYTGEEKISGTITATLVDSIGQAAAGAGQTIEEFLRDSVKDFDMKLRGKQWLNNSEKLVLEELTKISDDYKKYREAHMQADVDRANLILDVYKSIDSPDFLEKTQRLYARTIYEEEAFANEMFDKLMKDYEGYKAAVQSGQMEANAEYEAALSESLSVVGDALSDVSSRLQEVKKVYTDLRKAEREFSNLQGTAFGNWSAKENMEKAAKELKDVLTYSPDDYSSVFSALTQYESMHMSYLQAILAEYNRSRTETKELMQYQSELLNAEKTVLTTYHGEINQYSSALHKIDKDLASSKKKVEWFDEKTKQNLFNEQDYLVVYSKIADLQAEALADEVEYREKIANLSKEEKYMANILTEEYQERVEARKKELELVQAQLDLQKKQNALNSALQERNVRVWTGSGWKQIANVNNVTKAAEDLSDTRYKIEQKQTEMAQAEEVNAINAEVRTLNETIGRLDSEMTQAAKVLEEAQRDLAKQVKGADYSREDFKNALDDVVGDIQNRRDDVKRLGYDAKDKKEFDNTTTISDKLMEIWYYSLGEQDSDLKQFAQQIVRKMGTEFGLSVEEWEEITNQEDFLQRFGKGKSDLKSGGLNEAIAFATGSEVFFDPSEYIRNAKRGIGFEKLAFMFADGDTMKQAASAQSAAGYRQVIGDETYGVDQDAIDYVLANLALFSEDEIKNIGEKAIYFAKSGYEQAKSADANADVSYWTDLAARGRALIGDENAGASVSAEEYGQQIGVLLEEDNALKSALSAQAETAADAAFKVFTDTLTSYENLVTSFGNLVVEETGEHIDLTQKQWKEFRAILIEWVNDISAKYRAYTSAHTAETQTFTVQSNAAGTRDSKPGLSFVNEKGVEMLSTKYGQLIELNPHEKIFNNDQLNYLYDISKAQLSGMSSAVASMTANNNSLTISNLNIALDNVTDANSFVEGLKGLNNYIRNTKTIQRGSSY